MQLLAADANGEGSTALVQKRHQRRSAPGRTMDLRHGEGAEPVPGAHLFKQPLSVPPPSRPRSKSPHLLGWKVEVLNVGVFCGRNAWRANCLLKVGHSCPLAVTDTVAHSLLGSLLAPRSGSATLLTPTCFTRARGGASTALPIHRKVKRLKPHSGK